MKSNDTRLVRMRNLFWILMPIFAAGAIIIGLIEFGSFCTLTDRSDIMLRVLFYILLGLLTLDAVGAAVYTVMIRKRKRDITLAYHVGGTDCIETESDVFPSGAEKPPTHSSVQGSAIKVGPVMFGRTHHIGARQSQQDALGKTEFGNGSGMVAIVADGLGGLSGGDQVSQRIVMTALEYAAKLKPGQMDGVLPDIVRQVNDEVNRMLGADGLYCSGSTLVMVLVSGGRFHWISVGDSRIYLYRGGRMVQLNREHTLLQDWMPDILNGRMSYEEAVHNKEGVKLTSFIGMGQLKHVDATLRSMALLPDDRILLMSDGIFNTLTEEGMERILGACRDEQQAADQFEQAILNAHMRDQDNFTAVILGLAD